MEFSIKSIKNKRVEVKEFSIFANKSNQKYIFLAIFMKGEVILEHQG